MALPVKQPSFPFAPKESPPEPYSGAFSVMSILAICFLTVNTAISAVRSLDDPWTFAFVVSVYVLLMLLFLFLHLYDRNPTPGNYEKRERLKMPIWVLATALNVAFFAYQMAIIIDAALNFAVWTMAAFCTIAFCFFFIYRNKTNSRYAGDGQPLLDEQV